MAHDKASWMEEVLEKMEASSRVIPLLHKYPVRTDTEEMWEEGNVMLGFDAEERLLQKMPGDIGAHAIHTTTTSAHDAIAMLTRAGVPQDMLAEMMGRQRRAAVRRQTTGTGGRVEPELSAACPDGAVRRARLVARRLRGRPYRLVLWAQLE